MISSERLLPISAALLGISSNLRLPYGSKTTESGEWLIWCMIASAHGASMRRSQLGVLMMGGCTVGSGGRRVFGCREELLLREATADRVDVGESLPEPRRLVCQAAVGVKFC